RAISAAFGGQVGPDCVVAWCLRGREGSSRTVLQARERFLSRLRRPIGRGRFCSAVVSEPPGSAAQRCPDLRKQRLQRVAGGQRQPHLAPRSSAVHPSSFNPGNLVSGQTYQNLELIKILLPSGFSQLGFRGLPPFLIKS